MSLPFQFDVIYEDEWIVVINKPAGMPSQGTYDPKRTNLFSELQKKYREIYLHHRLDKDTSGVIMLSKKKEVNKQITDIFKEHHIQKTYHCLVKKNKNIEGTNWTIENHLAPVRSSNKQLMRMVEVKKGGWYAKTDFALIQNFKDIAYISASPKTGRTHQIRIHTALNKLPILGDNLYGGKSTLVPRLMLHAAELKLAHPKTHEPITFTAPLPQDFQTILTKMS